MKKAVFLAVLSAAAVIFCGCSRPGLLPSLSGDMQTEPIPQQSGPVTSDLAAQPLPQVTEEYPDISLSADEEQKIIGDYAAQSGTEEENIRILGYYGSYSAGEAVLIIRTDRDYTDDIKVFSVAGYEFELASGGYDILIHKDGGFTELSAAYEAGLLSEKDVKSIKHYFDN